MEQNIWLFGHNQAQGIKRNTTPKINFRHLKPWDCDASHVINYLH